jgi:hypothetical protein
MIGFRAYLSKKTEKEVLCDAAKVKKNIRYFSGSV